METLPPPPPGSARKSEYRTADSNTYGRETGGISMREEDQFDEEKKKDREFKKAARMLSTEAAETEKSSAGKKTRF